MERIRLGRGKRRVESRVELRQCQPWRPAVAERERIQEVNGEPSVALANVLAGTAVAVTAAIVSPLWFVAFVAHLPTAIFNAFERAEDRRYRAWLRGERSTP